MTNNTACWRCYCLGNMQILNREHHGFFAIWRNQTLITAG